MVVAKQNEVSGGEDLYQFTVELYGEAGATGQALASQSVAVDFSPAKEWAVFELCRQEEVDTACLDTSQARVVPSWHGRLGQPYLAGVEVHVSTTNGQQVPFSIPLNYFFDLANEASLALVEKGQLKAGEQFQYRVCAFPRQLPHHYQRSAQADDFAVETIVEPIHLENRSLAEFAGSSTSNKDSGDSSFPVFMRQQVLDEAIDRMQEAGVNETGGILIGHLYRNTNGTEIFAEVTAQIPARHTEQTSTRLKFTAETWTDVDAAVRIRGKHERYLGWWHSHNAKAWCQDCPVENRQQCKLNGEFFSTHDVALHRACFPKAYSIALVISDSYANGLTWPLFGWSSGMVAQRDFQIVAAASTAALSVVSSAPQH